ncbi:MAG: SAF domain-containing protein [Actinomycetota bacterium]
MFRRRLPTTAIVSFGTAALCAIAAIALLRGYATRLESTRPDLGPPVAIVVAAADLARGATLSESMLAERDVPASLEPPGAVPGIDALVGRVLASDLTAGEAVTETRLAGARAGPVAGLVPEGSLGMVVSSGLPAGAVAPGDRITLFATFGGRSPHTETVATGVEVVQILAGGEAGAVAGVDGGGGEPLVVVVDAVAAERIAYAGAFATLSVAVEAPLTVVPTSVPTPTTTAIPEMEKS